MFNLKYFLSCVLFLILKPQSIHANQRDGREYLEDILHFYGENKSISTEKLSDLLLLISARRSQSVTVDNPLAGQEVNT